MSDARRAVDCDSAKRRWLIPHDHSEGLRGWDIDGSPSGCTDGLVVELHDELCPGRREGTGTRKCGLDIRTRSLFRQRARRDRSLMLPTLGVGVSIGRHLPVSQCKPSDFECGCLYGGLLSEKPRDGLLSRPRASACRARPTPCQRPAHPRHRRASPSPPTRRR